MNRKYLIIILSILVLITVFAFFYYFTYEKEQASKKQIDSQKKTKLLPALPEYVQPMSGKTVERTINLSTGGTAQVVIPEELESVDSKVLENIIKKSQ